MTPTKVNIIKFFFYINPLHLVLAFLRIFLVFSHISWFARVLDDRLQFQPLLSNYPLHYFKNST